MKRNFLKKAGFAISVYFSGTLLEYIHKLLRIFCKTVPGLTTRTEQQYLRPAEPYFAIKNSLLQSGLCYQFFKSLSGCIMDDPCKIFMVEIKLLCYGFQRAVGAMVFDITQDFSHVILFMFLIFFFFIILITSGKLNKNQCHIAVDHIIAAKGRVQIFAENIFKQLPDQGVVLCMKNQVLVMFCVIIEGGSQKSGNGSALCEPVNEMVVNKNVTSGCSKQCHFRRLDKSYG